MGEKGQRSNDDNFIHNDADYQRNLQPNLIQQQQGVVEEFYKIALAVPSLQEPVREPVIPAVRLRAKLLITRAFTLLNPYWIDNNDVYEELSRHIDFNENRSALKGNCNFDELEGFLKSIEQRRELLARAIQISKTSFPGATDFLSRYVLFNGDWSTLKPNSCFEAFEFMVIFYENLTCWIRENGVVSGYKVQKMEWDGQIQALQMEKYHLQTLINQRTSEHQA